MKKVGIIVLVIVLILVIGAELMVFMRLKGCVEERTGAATGQTAAGEVVAPDGGAGVSESQVITVTPEPPPPPVVIMTDAPAPTAVPVTATPMPTPVPVTDTPIPTAEPTPTAVPASTGSFSSNTGTALNMNVDWRTEDLGNGTVRVYVTGKIVSYSLDVGGTSVTVTLNGQSTVCSVGSLLVGDGTLTTTDLFSTSLDVPAGTSGTMTVDWFFNGSYSGVSMPHITASGTVSA